MHKILNLPLFRVFQFTISGLRQKRNEIRETCVYDKSFEMTNTRKILNRANIQNYIITYYQYLEQKAVKLNTIAVGRRGIEYVSVARMRGCIANSTEK